jgi:hypothetical protein
MPDCTNWCTLATTTILIAVPNGALRPLKINRNRTFKRRATTGIQMRTSNRLLNKLRPAQATTISKARCLKVIWWRHTKWKIYSRTMEQDHFWWCSGSQHVVTHEEELCSCKVIEGWLHGTSYAKLRKCSLARKVSGIRDHLPRVPKN